MKDKPIAIIITLLGGAVASVCCIINGTGLLWTLLFVFLSLFVFMIIGLIINRFYVQIKAEVEAREKAEAAAAEEAERLEREALEKGEAEPETGAEPNTEQISTDA